MGRKRIPHVYDSMGAAAAAEGIDIGILKKAKRNGSPGFRGSRVFMLEVKKFLYPNGEKGEQRDLFETSDELDRKLKKMKLAKLKREEDEAMGRLVQREEVKTWMLGTAEKIKSILQCKLKSELPPKLEGLRAPEIAARMEAVIVEIVGLFRA